MIHTHKVLNGTSPEFLQLFRKALALRTTHLNADALMATSTILVYYSWATTDGFPASSSDQLGDQYDHAPASRLKLALKQLFSLSTGLRRIFTKSSGVIKSK